MPPDMATSWDSMGASVASAALRLTPAARLETYFRDQRRHQRYPIEMEAEFELLSNGGGERLGVGRTLNISTGGVLLLTDASLPAGGLIRLAMNWPFLLEGVCLLRLVVRGRIVRSDGRRIAVQTKHHEFRTAGRVQA